ncbi:MAG TPA: hypothetical protein VMR95_01950 [Candidatus Binatia bacterium]|nr:hypothetical protein [Candidatus Binatia bacterium]
MIRTFYVVVLSLLVVSGLVSPAFAQASSFVPAVGIAADPVLDNAYAVAFADGKVVTYNMHYYGRVNYYRVNGKLISFVSIVMTSDGRGYYLLARNGHVFGFGDAKVYTSADLIHSGSPFTAMTLTPGGYWLLTANGEVYSFGAAQYLGGDPKFDPKATAVAINTTYGVNDYRVTYSDGTSIDYLGNKGGAQTNIYKLDGPVVDAIVSQDGSKDAFWEITSKDQLWGYQAPSSNLMVKTIPAPIVGMSLEAGGTTIIAVDNIGYTSTITWPDGLPVMTS